MILTGAFAPLAWLALTAVLLVLLEAMAVRERGFARPLALMGIGVAAVFTWPWIGSAELDGGLRALDDALAADHFTAFVDLLILMAAGAAVLTGPRHEGARSEPGIALAALGASALAHANDLVLLLVAAELISVGLLVAILGGRPGRRDRIAARRHFAGAAITTALMVLGVGLLYAALSSTSLSGVGGRVAAVFSQWAAVQKYLLALESGQTLPAGLEQQLRGKVVTGGAPGALFIPGLITLLAGLLGKLWLVPGLGWRLEGIERAPRGTDLAVTVIPSLAVLAVLGRVFVGQLHAGRLVNEPYGWTGALPTIALVTAFGVHWIARYETRLRRRFALGSGGWMALALLAAVLAANYYGHRVLKSSGVGLAPSFELLWAHLAGDASMAAMLLILLAWSVGTLGALAGASALEGGGPDEAGGRLDQLAGLWSRDRGLALGLALCLLSLAGIPGTVGFVGMLSLARVMAEHSALAPVLVGLVGIWALGALAYLGPVRALWSHGEPVPGAERMVPAGVNQGARVGPRAVAIACGLLSVALGLAAGPVTRAAQLAVAGSSMAPGSDDRREWVEAERERWAAEDEAFRARTEGVGQGAEPNAEDASESTEAVPAEGLAETDGAETDGAETDGAETDGAEADGAEAQAEPEVEPEPEPEVEPEVAPPE